MAKYILESAGNINWMGLFALITFMIIFLTGVYLVLMDNKIFIQKMENLPLDSQDEIQDSTSKL
jgi:hypothetical protein